jgi:16S rRNA (guanine(966)-N(2))-methyltransferase RsmD
LRIIAGKKKGMKLLPPRGKSTRPIPDKVKESMFSVLLKYGMPREAKVADLFCGTGSNGIEALSRGAATAVFVEKDPAAVEILNKNLVKAGFLENSRTLSANAFKTGAAILSDQQKCDLVFVDPPYALSKDTAQNSRLGKLLALLADQLAEKGVICVRTDKRTLLERCYASLETVEVRKWGTMCVSFLQHALTPTDPTEPDENREPQNPEK